MPTKKYRIVSDSMGQMQVPSKALYQAQTQRAIDNFPISGSSMPSKFIKTLALIKAAAAKSNQELGLLPNNIAVSIQKHATEIALSNAHLDQFPIDIYQTGSGTSSNMNMNEVLSTLVSEQLQKQVSANDHINMGQSSNDVIPTCIHVSAALAIKQDLQPALTNLAKQIRKKGKTLSKVVKTGRTHLMDAMPITFQQELDGWALQIEKAQARLADTHTRLCQIAQGGTAVGTGVNAHPKFAKLFAKNLSALTGLKLKPNDSFFESLSCQDTAAEASGQLKVLAISLMKISNDLRWMNSGPLTGLAELELRALQPGSSIMPGKVNPVICEATTMVCAQVIGNDTAITVGAQAGNFQLNVMLPMIANNLLSSIKLLAACCPLLAQTIVESKVQRENLKRSLAVNPILVTALNPLIGYHKAAQIAKIAYQEKKPVVDVALEHTSYSRKELEALLDPYKLTNANLANLAKPKK